ncbi:hypothetical protein MCOR27_003257 [Pyricularia oryzae]|uniref:N-acetyltransferase domain-containing protein n=5 Tax=Pyricularia TaxID=48558 RepID=A0ABQ8NQ49_PYRGI|nr:uncharacterized protein MGG_08333 [Pyricularia oryzae 70-15]ELQ43501.1 hypothetical protein OOU_Y34scaffold00148g4 [Pyricularia oryzae Y34]KAH8836332.1 hypothetical protein MCOR01_011627 [Pyricularia oryzae]KAI6300497.1 hypothetical protein MCOR33_003771 [Pyricularia grisea]EHA55924.1 hypothetical protein MGG_08333 [Pyricularia oryzae 70-15]KAH9439974.1 hypothetical protein MCOR02_003507 [Pyricularia oryzae]
MTSVPETQLAADVQIQICPSSMAADTTITDAIATMVNECYLAAEGDLWRPKDRLPRTDPAVVSSLIAAGDLVVAWSPSGAVAGCASLSPYGDGGLMVGMLATARRGGGLGGRIMAFCEDEAERRAGMPGAGSCCAVEFWRPRGPVPHAGKERLFGWYRRLGYQVVKTEDLADSRYADFVRRLVVEIDSIILEKKLSQ